MTVTVYTDSFHGGRGHKTSDSPDLAEAVRAAATDLAALSARTDTSMQTKLDATIARQTALRTALDALVAKYNLHRGTAGVHLEADSTNTVAAPAATDITTDILLLLNDEVVQYELHRVNIAGGIHGAADATNDITATNPATDETEAAALGADLYTQYEAHRVFLGGGCHGAADNTNTIGSASPSDWDSLITFCNEFKNTTAYEQHRILTGGGEHGAADATSVVTAADSGVQKTALELQLNEFKTDVNAHIASAFIHPNAGAANGTAAATTEATSVALINGLKATVNTHMSAADDHLDADAVTAQVAGTATEYEDILAVAAEFLVSYDLHRVITTVHAKADAGNAGVVVGAGGDVAALGSGSAASITLVAG
ncbi:MAG: hypothetical protein KAS32_19645 [Candidatus Peribacteraceae bacterium]|nr:hypothetical protein [Candidatus Peribacteraceae bacterium]